MLIEFSATYVQPSSGQPTQTNKTMKTNIITLFIAAALLGAGALIAADKDAKPAGVPADYPLKKCPVSDELLGEMGKPVKVTHEGTDVYLCCKSCLKDFNKDPGTYTKMVKDAAPKK
jgi:YHS domain-containing protein